LRFSARDEPWGGGDLVLLGDSRVWIGFADSGFVRAEDFLLRGRGKGDHFFLRLKRVGVADCLPMPEFLSLRSASPGAEVAAFRERLRPRQAVGEVVAPILAAVRAEGDAALLRYTEQLDGVRLSPEDLRLSPEPMAAAWGRLPAEQRRHLRSAAKAIRDFHRQSRPRGWATRNADGLRVGEKFDPLRRVGLYIPGGQVPLVSTVLMTAIPAQVAGVASLAVCTPPGPDGKVSPGLLAAFHALGLREVYRVGGAQAVAALAYGTATVPPVDLVAGPGNAYVTEGKRQLFGRVGVDLLPGPSEVMVVADDDSDPDWVAADLLAQAEHGSGEEKLYAVLPDRKYWRRVESALRRRIPELPNRDTVENTVERRLLVGTGREDDAIVAFANAVAPEHLELLLPTARATRLTRRITTAGAILQGPNSPTVLGDFVAGPSHTLPTDGTGRFSGGLQVTTFLRRTSVVRSSPAANRRLQPVVETLAALERLPAHRDSLRARTGTGEEEAP